MLPELVAVPVEVAVVAGAEEQMMKMLHQKAAQIAVEGWAARLVWQLPVSKTSLVLKESRVDVGACSQAAQDRQQRTRKMTSLAEVEAAAAFGPPASAQVAKQQAAEPLAAEAEPRSLTLRTWSQTCQVGPWLASEQGRS